MSTIIETLKITSAVKNTEYLRRLKACGFSTPTHDYSQITPDAIQEFLSNIAREYEKKHRRAIFPRFQVLSFGRADKYIGEPEGFKLIYRYGLSLDSKAFIRWIETPVNEARYLPPEHILSSIEKARKTFKDIRIVTIDSIPTQIKDPLVVGLRGKDPIRYLIDWWDKDIDPTLLVKLPSSGVKK